MQRSGHLTSRLGGGHRLLPGFEVSIFTGRHQRGGAVVRGGGSEAHGRNPILVGGWDGCVQHKTGDEKGIKEQLDAPF